MIISCLHLYMYILVMMIVCPYWQFVKKIGTHHRIIVSFRITYLFQHPDLTVSAYVRILLDQFLWFVEHPEVIGYWVRDSISKCTIIRKVKSEDKWKENTENCQISKLIGTCSQNFKTTFYIFFYPINLLLYSFVRRYSPENHHFITLIQGNEGVLAVILIVRTLSCGLLPAHHHIRNLLECSSRKYFIVLLIRTLKS